jgi:HD-GYP domain-containing protein (c-di-GMP phosphodiesterase class II)
MRLASALAREMGLGEPQISSVGYAASVHDVGMRTLGEQIERAGSLSDDQRAELKRHPEFSADILAPLEPVGEVRDMILAHHEWWDGSGYPNGLEGEAIPVGARILAVVDAFESMTVGRPHREAVSREEALEEIERLKGRQFDPVVVAALSQALERLERDATEHPTKKASASDTGR